MSFPNLLTLSRVILAFLIWPLLFGKFIEGPFLALLIFMVASLTDLLDGLVARKQNKMTAFGAVMDPIADKILILTTFFAFAKLKIFPIWIVWVILVREVIVTCLRLWVIQRGIIMPAQRAGKQKTVSQIVTALVILVFLSLKNHSEHSLSFWDSSLEMVFLNTSLTLALLTAGFTLISGVAYLRDFKKGVQQKQTPDRQ